MEAALRRRLAISQTRDRRYRLRLTHYRRSSSEIRGVANLLNSLVGLGRVELPTSPLSGVRSSHLSYRPVGRPRWLKQPATAGGKPNKYRRRTGCTQAEFLDLR